MANLSASMVTLDGARTWSELSKDGEKFWSLRFRSTNRGWSLDRWRSLYETVDGGDTWTRTGELPASFS